MESAYIDIAVAVLTVLSVIVGFWRGFIRELFTIVGWLAAALATVVLMPYLRDIGRGMISSALLADLATSAVIFMATLGLVAVLSHSLSASVNKTGLSFFDRTLGVVFGGLRALLVFALAYIVVAWIWEPKDRPDWIMEARSRPIIESVAGMIVGFIPGTDDIEIEADGKSGKDALDNVMRPEDQKKISERVQDLQKDVPAYTETQREKLNKVFQQSDE